MKKKIISVILLFLVIFLSTNVFAAYVSSENATLEIVENNVCRINITDQAVFEKKIIDYNLENKELTIGMTVTNNAIAPLDKPSEIVLVIDNSLSMKETISTGGSRMQAVSNSAKMLAEELLKLNTVELSVVSFSTVNNDGKVPGSNDYVNEGTLADAKLRVSLTKSKDDVTTAIDAVANDATGVRTDIEAGLTLASQQFTGNVDNKYIILLTDGVPNISLGSNSILYSGQTATNTRNALTNISNSGIKILSMMTGVSDDINSQTGTTYRALAEEVFGTPTNPTVGKFYYITDDEIEETISKTILDELKAPEDDLLTDIDVYDYFPQEILDNFDFEYVQTPTKGTVTSNGDYIVWHIDKLSYQESASLSFKLKLKENINEDINEVILSTNKKVDITCGKVTNDDGTKRVLTSEVTPKIKITLPPEPTPTPTPTPDETVAPEPIPQTGVIITASLLFGGAVITGIGFGIRAIVKSKELK